MKCKKNVKNLKQKQWDSETPLSWLREDVFQFIDFLKNSSKTALVRPANIKNMK